MTRRSGAGDSGWSRFPSALGLEVPTPGVWKCGRGQRTPKAEAGGCQQGVLQECLKDWEWLDMQKQKTGIPIEAKAIGPPPTRRPDPREVAGLDPLDLGLWAKPAARTEDVSQPRDSGLLKPGRCSLRYPSRALVPGSSKDASKLRMPLTQDCDQLRPSPAQGNCLYLLLPRATT